SDPHHYAGGLLGVVFVLSSVLLVRHLGVLAAGLGMIAGQLLGSIVLDAWIRGPVGPGGLWLTSLSALVLLVGVAVVSAG
ncbi:DMT family transporter, partial [Bacillus safensis]|uniref:DMT family transporter n=1 Tax=Bacillus safensis TaxID=561879 RepID=UPI003AA99A20